jgi:hypothetical protein
MQLIYRTDVVIAAVTAYLDENSVAKDAPYSRQAVIYDQLNGWLEVILKAAVKPSYVSLDDDDSEILNPYLKEM